MSNFTWGSNPFKKVAADESGVSTLQFALAMPIVLALTLGGLDLSLLVLDYHRAASATHAAARQAVIESPVADLSNLQAGSKVLCVGSGSDDTVTCNGTSVGSQPAFTEILQQAQSYYPALTGANLMVEYEILPRPFTDGPTIPPTQVTAKLNNVQFDFKLIPALGGGVGTYNMPSFATTMTSASRGS